MAVEVAAGLWARTLATADVAEGLPLGPCWLAEVERDLARRGESPYLLDTSDRGGARLLRAAAVGTSGAKGRIRPDGGIGCPHGQ